MGLINSTAASESKSHLFCHIMMQNGDVAPLLHPTIKRQKVNTK